MFICLFVCFRVVCEGPNPVSMKQQHQQQLVFTVSLLLLPLRLFVCVTADCTSCQCRGDPGPTGPAGPAGSTLNCTTLVNASDMNIQWIASNVSVTFTSPNTFTVPAGVTLVTITTFDGGAGGGGGAGSAATNGGAGGGGSGGAGGTTNIVRVSVTGGQSIQIVAVGAGGSGGAAGAVSSSGGLGGSGGQTSVVVGGTTISGATTPGGNPGGYPTIGGAASGPSGAGSISPPSATNVISFQTFAGQVSGAGQPDYVGLTNDGGAGGNGGVNGVGGGTPGTGGLADGGHGGIPGQSAGAGFGAGGGGGGGSGNSNGATADIGGGGGVGRCWWCHHHVYTHDPDGFQQFDCPSPRSDMHPSESCSHVDRRRCAA